MMTFARDRVAQLRARTLCSNSTDAERHLWYRLRRRQVSGYRFRRQVPIGAYIADFACLEAGLVVELDGGQHAMNREYDKRRDRDLALRGFRVLRFWDNEVLLETDAVVEKIMAVLVCPHPNPPPQAGEGA